MAATTHLEGSPNEYRQFTALGNNGQFTMTVNDKAHGRFRVAFGPTRPGPKTRDFHHLGGYDDPSGSIGRLSVTGLVWVMGMADFAATRAA